MGEALFFLSARLCPIPSVPHPVDLDAQKATIRTPTGAILTYRRWTSIPVDLPRCEHCGDYGEVILHSDSGSYLHQRCARLKFN